MEKNGISIAVVDNDPWALQSIARWIDGSSPSHHVIWKTTSASETLHRCLFGSGQPDVLILDIALNDASGVSVCAKIRQHTADIGIIGITAYDPGRYASDFARAGAQAIIAKERLTRECLAALPIVAEGNPTDPGMFMPAQQAHAMIAAHHSSAQFSPRERQILHMVVRGMSTSDIAAELGISPNTVFTHIHRVSIKLGTSNRSQIIQRCKQYDIL
ncbi:response regulator transcription factor [Bifidobacterium thermophilum]|uniref:response regulator transcription factor n=1 Tax=Bifidobacterium thermophilum TaxID=33905 RepID=UPI0030955E90